MVFIKSVVLGNLVMVFFSFERVWLVVMVFLRMIVVFIFVLGGKSGSLLYGRLGLYVIFMYFIMRVFFIFVLKIRVNIGFFCFCL